MSNPSHSHSEQSENAPLLAENNALVCLDSGVWVDANDTQREFIGYTDGDASENAVYDAVSNAKDRSVDSYELDVLWGQWALEYHLGAKRANIYRGLNLSGVKRVLEVGCGCGAITRFLGEQGFKVDAIEGTLRRAQIARLRTQDLSNVQLVSSNYHQLSLPDNAYDLIVFTGVLEYSGAYSQAGLSPEDQLAQTLNTAQEALAPEGVIVVAIENRTGFKYVAGASEDHLNVPNIGLLNYPEPASGAVSRGIRTWSKRQWSTMLDKQAGINGYSFCYPFPDYKVPEVILSDHFIENAQCPAELINGVRSRDYFKTWRSPVDESLFWKTAAETGSLGEYANSFLIVLAKQPKRLSEIIDFDFVRFPSSRRIKHFRYQINKPVASNTVKRIPQLRPAEHNIDVGPVVGAGLLEEPFCDGFVLLQSWMDRLTVSPSFTELAMLLREYNNWLIQRITLDAAPRLLIDALPQNIIVGANDNWQLIDKEWLATEDISSELVFFRAAYYLGLSARDQLVSLSLLSAQKGLDTNAPPALLENLGDFIHWCFAAINNPITQVQFDSFVKWEAAMQEQVVRDTHREPVADVLAEPMGTNADHTKVVDLNPVEVRVFWTQVDGVWHLDHSAVGKYHESVGLQAVVDLPAMITTHPFIQINPAHYRINNANGWLDFDNLSIEEIDSEGLRKSVFEIKGIAQLLKSARIENISVTESGVLMFTSLEPKLTLNIKSADWSADCVGAALTFRVKAPLVQDYVDVHQALVGVDNGLAARIRNRQTLLTIQDDRIAQASEKLANLEKQISEQSSVKPNHFWEKIKKKWV